MADSKLLADVLATRLGLTSQDLAQAIPQLGAVLSGPEQQPSQSTGVQSSARQVPTGQQAPTGLEPSIS